MNKVIACLLLAVALLGMALVMLNQQLTPPAPSIQGPQSATSKLPDLPDIEGGRQSPPPVQEGQTARQGLPPLPDSLGVPGAEHRAPVTSATLAEARSQQPEPAGQPDQPAVQADPGSAPVSVQPDAEKPSQAEADADEARRLAQARAEAEARKQEAKRQEQARAEAEARKQEAKRQEQASPAKIRTGKVIVFARDKGATVRLSSADPIAYKHMVLKEPDRVVVDLQGSWSVSAAGVPRNVLVTNIRFGSFPGRTRVVIDMKDTPRQTRFSQSKDRRQLDVRVDQ
ncbi:MAG: AMIN domain-containing protein [Desulfovibrio sp.]|nr:AMIN domain-containing protein [Desulfovibrio sp.]